MKLRKRENYWSPMTELRNRINRMFDVPEAAGGEMDLFSAWAPAVDVHEDRDKVVVTAELPGMQKNDIDVSVHENTLLISGERKCEEEKSGAEYYQCERYFGKFQRSIALPHTVDTSKVEAKYKDGILTVTLPKSEQAKARQIQISGD
ncbi:MAG: Hsp20/alpha crystallin family protein [Verrucomicrobiota bacterium]|jgi:HSP20 family protein